MQTREREFKMKNIVTVCSIFAATAGTALASIAPVQYTGPIFGTDPSENLNGDPTGNPFFVAPGFGNAADGFFLAGSGPFADTSAGAMMDNIGGNIDGVSSIFVDSVVTDNGGGNFDIVILLYTDGADLAPSGFSGGTAPIDTLGFFMGANAGGTNLDFSDVAITNSASIELFNAAGPAGGPFDIVTFGDFTADAGGWDGSLGVTFGAGSAGAGITGIELRVNVDVVPAPSGMALLGLGGLVATRRRR